MPGCAEFIRLGGLSEWERLFQSHAESTIGIQASRLRESELGILLDLERPQSAIL
jgi:hypothetical protein